MPSDKKPVEVVASTGGLLDSVKRYLHDSRDLFTSMVLVLPLFLMYQVGVIWLGGVRNGVDFMTSAMWAASGESAGVYMLINLALLLVFGGFTYFLRERGTFRPQIWPAVIAESTIYAMLFGGAVIKLMTTLGLGGLLAAGGGQAQGIFGSFILSLGAGLYEEITFRLIGMGGLFWGLTRLTPLPRWANAAIAVVVSSLIFSAIHHIGALGDPFTLGTFTFRFFAGVLLALIFYLRGFAVAVYTHAIYDIIVMVFK